MTQKNRTLEGKNGTLGGRRVKNEQKKIRHHSWMFPQVNEKIRDETARLQSCWFFLGKIFFWIFFSHLFICCCFLSFVYLLFTHGKFDIFHAGFTLNIATPMKFTLAPFLDLGLNRFESAIATHGRTPIRTFGVFFANPTMGS